MTQEEKARAYDKAIERARLSRLQLLDIGEEATEIEYIFPELKESEDERIRKELIEYIKDQQSSFISAPDCRDKYEEEENNKYNSWIAWLEKQGEQKPVDKVEPKFHEGEWITNREFSTQIVAVGSGLYVINRKDMSEVSLPTKYVEKWYHLWTIQDAKDADVLYSLDSKQPFIFKHRKKHEQAEVYCGINIYGKFFVGNTKDCIITTDKYIPATKEQRDLLFQKMKEAGYEWDAEKKELKKIEQEPAGWSEEDENRFNNLIFLVECSDENEPTKNGFIDFINRLKSLRPQSQWKPSDEQMKALSNAGNSFRPFEEGHKVLWSLYNDLKKLREE